MHLSAWVVRLRRLLGWAVFVGVLVGHSPLAHAIRIRWVYLEEPLEHPPPYPFSCSSASCGISHYLFTVVMLNLDSDRIHSTYQQAVGSRMRWYANVDRVEFTARELTTPDHFYGQLLARAGHDDEVFLSSRAFLTLLTSPATANRLFELEIHVPRYLEPQPWVFVPTDYRPLSDVLSSLRPSELNGLPVHVWLAGSQGLVFMMGGNQIYRGPTFAPGATRLAIEYLGPEELINHARAQAQFGTEPIWQILLNWFAGSTRPTAMIDIPAALASGQISFVPSGGGGGRSRGQSAPPLLQAAPPPLQAAPLPPLSLQLPPPALPFLFGPGRLGAAMLFPGLGRGGSGGR